MVADHRIAPSMRTSKHGTRVAAETLSAFREQRSCVNLVASRLILDWSPEQIAGWLKAQYPDNESMRVSHETIYRSLFIQARGALKKELTDHLRSKRRMRRSRHAIEHGHSRAGRSRCHLDPRKTCGGRRSSDPGSLGRRSVGVAQRTVISRPWWNASRAL